MLRGRIKSALRAWFEAEGFVEVEPGCLQVSPGNETHLHAFATDLVGTDLVATRRYLHTSPEFAMKKLLAAGEERIFAFAPVFRNREHGPLHAPEFTMLEWYRAGAPYEALWRDCRDILRIAAQTTGHWMWHWRERKCDLRTMLVADIDRISLHEAFAQHAALSLDDAFDGMAPDTGRFKAAAERIGVKCAADDTWSDVFSRVLTERVDPHLGHWRPEILHAYPISEAALAQPDAADPRLAHRFELYVSGVELANGFAELTDAAEQRRRFEAEMDLKAQRYGERYPIDEEFLAALGHMPSASGCALGFDRLVMLATGATKVDDVLWTPLAR
jgi:lysyl-tRNA synthetase class 2